MTAQNSVRSYLGVAKETTKGTPVAPTAFIPVTKDKLKTANIIDPLMDDGLRGSSVAGAYNYIQGRTRSTVDFGGPVFADTVPWAVAGLLGSVATTGASAPYTHTISLKNDSTVGGDVQPTAFTFTDFYAADVRAYSGCQIHDFALSFDASGLLEYDAKATGWLSASASTPTPSFTTVTPTPVWQATVSLAGTPVAYTVSGSLNATRAVTPIYGLSATQNPYQVFVGGLSVTGQLKFVMENNAELTRFLSNTQPSITVDWSQGAGATATQFAFTLTKGAYTTAVYERSADYVEITVDVTGIANTTDAGATGGYAPIKFTAKNAVASGIYQ